MSRPALVLVACLALGCSREDGPSTRHAPTPSEPASSLPGVRIRVEPVQPPVDEDRYRLVVEGLAEHQPHALPELLVVEVPGEEEPRAVRGVVAGFDGRGFVGFLDQLPPEGAWVRWGHGFDMVRVGRISVVDGRDPCATWDGVVIWGERDQDGLFWLHFPGVPEPAERHCGTCGSMVRVGDETVGAGGWGTAVRLAREPEDGACVCIDLDGRMRRPETPIGRYRRHRRGD